MTGLAFGRFLGPLETMAAVLTGSLLFGVLARRLGSRIDRFQSALTEGDA